jgi:signal transduction histidine kinase
MLLLAGAYYGSAKLGYQLEFAGPVAAIVWPPVGVGIAFLYLGGPQLWPGVVIGDLLANQYSTLPIGSALMQTAGNTLEIVVGALLIRRLVRRGGPLDSVSGVAALVGSIAVATAISATIGTGASLAGGVINGSDVPEVWRTWWLGDSCGALVIVPLALAWWRRPIASALTPRRVAEAASGLVLTAGLAALTFRTKEPVAYLVFPGLIWAALRFRQRGATLAVTIAVVLAVWNTTHAVGPFTYTSLTRSLLNVQLFIFVAALSSLCLAAVVSERERAVQRLRASRARLVRAGDEARLRLEQNLHDGAQQRLTALQFRLGEIGEEVGRSPRRAGRLVTKAESELQLAVDELRELAHGIHPALLTSMGLLQAVNDIASRSPVPIERSAFPSQRLPDATEATAYYVIAEAVTNAQRHASASTIHVAARISGNTLHVDVRDDGSGGARESGSGLQGLRDRVEAAGGTFRVESASAQGTLVAAAIPVGS